MRPSDSGKITFKAILSIAFIVAVIYCGIKVIPVYVNNYQLQDYIQTQTPFWLTQRAPADVVLKSILAKAQDLDLPLGEDDVTIVDNPSKVSVNIDLHVPVDLMVFTLPLHFTDTSENKSIL
jgi:hypothetical protein